MPLPGTPETRGAGSIAARPMPKRSPTAHNLQPFLQPARDVSFKIGYSMAMYRVYRMKDAPRQQFRWAPHVAGALRIWKYVGFESASWVVPEVKSAPKAPPDPAAQTIKI